MSKESSKKNVIVVGGGFGGLVAAQGLSAKLNHHTHNLILITARPINIHIIAGLRLAVSSDKKLSDSFVFPYDRVFKPGKGTVKLGKVVSINAGRNGKGGDLSLENGETLTYEVLVLATGSQWPGPLGFPDDKSEFRTYLDSWREKFRSAKDIVIVGGGAVGIELAGELRDEYPKKKITLIHGSPYLLNSVYHDKFRRRIEVSLRNRNIDLVLNEWVESFPRNDSGEVVLRSGKNVSGDLVIRAVGPKPNTEFIGASLGEDVLTTNKYVKVTPKLQLPSHPSIFAMMDIIDWPEQHTAAKANKQVPVVVSNVMSYLTGGTPSTDYKGMPEFMLVTNGKGGGVFYLPFLGGIVLGDFFARMMKSKGLMVELTRKPMGY